MKENNKPKLHLTIELDGELIETIVEAVVKELSEGSEANTTVAHQPNKDPVITDVELLMDDDTEEVSESVENVLKEVNRVTLEKYKELNEKVEKLEESVKCSNSILKAFI